MRQQSGRRIAGHAQGDGVLDPYQAKQKPAEPTLCRQCGAIYRRGRWEWGNRPEGAHETLCPACRRTNEGFPAGIVTLHGAMAVQRKDQIVGLARNEEAAEKREHPLNRVISIEGTDNGLVINTTDIHLPRRLGEAIKRAFHGTLEMRFEEAGYFVRVDWRPPA